MTQYLRNRWSHLRLKLQNVDNKLSKIFPKVNAQLIASLLQLFPHILYIFCGKGGIAMQKLEQQNADCPDID